MTQRSYVRRELDANPGWQNTHAGVYWTSARICEALRGYVASTAGLLPSSSDKWSALKRGRLDLPVAAYVLREYGSMGAAWEAAGAPPARLPPGNRPWTEEEITYLLDNAGDLTLKQIAARLHRTWPACKRKLYELGTTARDAGGYMSAQQVADEYGCSASRVQDLITRGVLRARRPRGRQRFWRIDPEDARRVAGQLRHDESPPQDAFERWLTPTDVAERVGITPKAVYVYLNGGELPSVRRGRRYYIAERSLRGWQPRSMRVLGMTEAELDALPTMRREAVAS